METTLPWVVSVSNMSYDAINNLRQMSLPQIIVSRTHWGSTIVDWDIGPKGSQVESWLGIAVVFDCLLENCYKPTTENRNYGQTGMGR